MSQSIPRTVKQWKITGKNGFDSLEFCEEAVPALGDNQVLVKIQGASLNYRDLIIPHSKYSFPEKKGVVAGSDGAGTVLAVGKHVQRFKPGDKVVTLFNQTHLGGNLDDLTIQSGLGGVVDGTLRTVGAFDENGLVHMPSGLSFIEAATLTCAGLTAWNGLFGLTDKRVSAGQWVLTQGTGGVSIFAVQFAKAIGARVIATTSSNEKAELLKKLGADHIINYREVPDWGIKAKELTGGAGVDHVVEVAGPTSMKQSLSSVKIDGLISIIGSVGGSAQDQPGFLDNLTKLCTTRGFLVGSRTQMEDMCRAVEANVDKLRPVVDPKVFTLEQVKEAYEYQWAGKHQGKVCIQIG
ncbi:alcohol dehydrogenase [Fusarium oxysporum f. sp. conglutinans race 2 54008]|uniref:Alcohol dehydrogenase n=1 Tax=Fusarium oxysporum f. sp. conglutinans race 2 54008 TaxID=1089457 RepID=X0HWL1_FUSOX|nr:alcohol dehydrogenase [Fusarium oxysporum f. sp. conglutinans race 2 54008]KAG6989637.1 Zinc-type alcohol dehydrogenase-like protein [Fusarium oxysporum f. sp. conglutinans]